MLVKPVVAFLIVTAMGYGTAIAIEVGLSLAQIGEFSFLLAALAKGLGVLPAEASNAIVATAIVTIMVNPLLCRLGSRTEAFLERHPRLWRAGNWGTPKLGAAPESRLAVAHRTVLVGYGPIGRLVGRILARRGIGFTVIEMNLETHRRLVEEGHTAVYGDANRAEVLESAGIRQAESLVLSASGAAGSTEAIRVAREMNAGIHVVARADFLRETAGMRRAGADEVFSGEGEVAMAMTDSILRRLGATPEQLDEAREAIRRKLIEEQV
jgi:CPA2 family monovalent cation:H+ antiporter-2